MNASFGHEGRAAITLVMAIDETYAMQLAVVLASIAHSCEVTQELEVFVLQDGVSITTRRRVESAVTDTGIDVEWVDVPPGLGEGYQTGIGISRVTYFRLLAEELLPTAVRRALYLDADVVVCEDLQALWAADLGTAPVGAVRSGWCPWFAAPGGVGAWRELGLDPRTPYFNAGVMLLDLELMRETQLGRRALDFAETRASELEFGDQEALNATLAGDWRELPPRWNVQPYIHERLSMAQVIWSHEDIVEARDSPGIVHYLSRDKPWTSTSTHPQTELWFQMVDRTPWQGWRPSPRGSRDVARDRLTGAWRVLRHGSIRGRRTVAGGRR